MIANISKYLTVFLGVVLACAAIGKANFSFPIRSYLPISKCRNGWLRLLVGLNSQQQL